MASIYILYLSHHIFIIRTDLSLCALSLSTPLYITMPKRKRKKQAKEDKGNIVYKYNGVYKTKKYFGVYKRGFKKFKAQVLINNKMFYPGTFKTALEAAKAHDHARIQAGHPITKLNFPDQVPKNYKPKKKKLRSENTIGYRGVTKRNNRFEARIRIEGKNKTIGYFGTKKEAALAFDYAALQAKRPISDLNFPDMMDDVKMKMKMKMKKKKKVVIKKKIKIKKSSTSTKSGSSSSSSSSLHILATLSGHVSRKFQEKY